MRVGSCDGDGGLNLGMGVEGVFDFAELDAVSADLDLVVDPSQAFESAVGPPSCEVAGAVEAVSWFSKRVGEEPFGGEARGG